jgi:chromosomal replication initiator protein
MVGTPEEFWTRVLDSARPSFPPQSYRTWLAPTRATAWDGQLLIVETPSPFHTEWVEDKFAATLTDLASRLLGQPVTLEFVTALNSAPYAPPAPPVDSLEPDPTPWLPPRPAPPPGASSTNAAADPPAEPAEPPSLNARYTFERFVVGTNNQLAAAACHAVAETPARTYNPLFLYGGVGLGKTHLMHAVGHRLLDRSPGQRVSYVSAERFMNDLVQAIQTGTTGAFRRRYRQIDLLLVDDVQFFVRKESTQEEFFHTFNTLYDAGKQIILTSDRPPKDLPGLEARLVSRFEWGLVVDIKPPDYETRVAILQKKAQDDGITLYPDVIDYLARSCTSSVRELEGAVIKLLAYSSLRREEITPSLAREALQGMLRPPDAPPPLHRGDHAPSVKRVQEVVAAAFHVTVAELQSRKRTRQLTVPRQIAMYLMHELLHLSLVAIGSHFGGRDHSTVIHSIRKVTEDLAADPVLQSQIDDLRRTLTH